MPKLEPNILAEKGAAAIKAVAPEALRDTVLFQDAVTFVVDKSAIVAVLEALRKDKDLSFTALSDVTAVDWLEHGREPRFEVVYHLQSYEHFHFLRLRCPVAENEGEDSGECSIDSVCGLWTGASFMEREVFDMFGIHFNNHPDLRRILMPDNWEGHPLRKDHPLGGATSFYFKQDTSEYAGEPDDLVPRIRVQTSDI